MFVKILAGLLAAASVTLVGVYIANGPTDLSAPVQTVGASSSESDSGSHPCCALASRSECLVEMTSCCSAIENEELLSNNLVAAGIGSGLMAVNMPIDTATAD